MNRMLLHIVPAWILVGIVAAPVLAEPPDHWLKKAQTLDKQGFLDEAAQAWEKLATTDTNKKRVAYARLKLAGTYFKLDQFQQSIDTARSAILVDPESFDAHFHLANFLSGTGKFQEAVDTFRKTVALNPEEGLGYVGLGLCLFANRNPGEAVEVILEAAQLFKKKKNISWHRNTRVMSAQIKHFAQFPPNFSDLWVTNNLKLIRETYERTVFDPKTFLR